MQHYIDVVQDRAGNAISGASVLVRDYPGGTTSTIYLDNGVTTTANPLTTDSSGGFSFYAANGRYQFIISSPTITTATVNDILLFDSAVSSAPSDADYLVKTANASLSAERVVTDTANNITWDWATAGQAKANVAWAAPGTIGSGTPNTGAFTTVSATGVITSTLATGTAPLTVASTTVVGNLNVSSLLGGTWAAPGAIGSTTSSTGVFTTVNGMTITSSTGTFTLSNGKTFAVTNGLTLSGTDSTVMTFPAASDTVAALGTAETFTKAQRGAFVALTDAATVAVDLSLSNQYSLTLGGNRTLGVPTNTVEGQQGVISIRQDSTGSRTLAYAWPYEWAGGTAGTLSTPGCSRDQLVYSVEKYATSTVTITNATPGVVSWTAHGLENGQRIQLTTTGTLPTGLSPSTTYFVSGKSANDFKLSTTLANAAAGTQIATSSAGSGTHTCTAFSISLALNKAYA